MNEHTKEDDLFGRTWKTVVVLVGGCVLFVGALSTTAVLIASKAVAPSTSTSDTGGDATADTKADAKVPAKKPLSI